MNTKDNSEIRELDADELNEVTGRGGVKIPRPPVGPAVLPTTPTVTPPATGTGSGEGGGDGAFYGDPHRLD
jgi:hypothetical protein